MRFALVLVLLAGCYVDRPYVVTRVQWHNIPVPCMTSSPPDKPTDVFCYSDWEKYKFTSREACEQQQLEDWSMYGQRAFLFIQNNVEPTCYQAAGVARAK